MLAAAITTSVKVWDVVLAAAVVAIAYFGFKERNATLLTIAFITALTCFAILFTFGS